MKNVVNSIEDLKKALYRGLVFDSIFRSRCIVVLNDDCSVDIYRSVNSGARMFSGITGNTSITTYHKNGQVEIYVPIIKDIEVLLKEGRIFMDDLKRNYICSTSLEVLVGFCCNKKLRMATSYSYNDYRFTTLIEFLDEEGNKLNIKIHKTLPKDFKPEIVGHVNPKRKLWSEHVVEFENVYRWPDGTISALVGDGMPKSWHTVEEANLERPEYWSLPEYRGSVSEDCEAIIDSVKYSVTPEGIFKAPITGYRSVDRVVEVTDGPSDGDSWGFGATRGSVTYKTTETEDIPVFGEMVRIAKEDLPDLGDKKYELFRNMIEGYELTGYDYKKLVQLYKDRENEYIDACNERSRKQKKLLQDWIDSQEWYQF